MLRYNQEGMHHRFYKPYCTIGDNKSLTPKISGENLTFMTYVSRSIKIGQTCNDTNNTPKPQFKMHYHMALSQPLTTNSFHRAIMLTNLELIHQFQDIIYTNVNFISIYNHSSFQLQTSYSH